MFKMQGYCPFQYQHSKNNSKTDFNIIATATSLFCRCFHTSCSTNIQELNQRLNEEFKKVKQEQQRVRLQIEEQRLLKERETVLSQLTIANIEEKILETIEFKNISEAYAHSSRVKSVEAPTGAGKTYAAVLYFLKKIKNGEFVIYCTSNKTSMQEFVDLVEQITGRNLSEIYIQELRRGYKLEEGKEEEGTIDIDDNSNKINESTLGIITHHTYLGRKGISNLYYSLLSFIEKKNATIIIDEIDTYIQSQTHILELQSRYQKLTSKGMDYANYYKRNKCSGSKNRPNCSNCHNICTAEYDVNKDGIPELRQKYKVKETDLTSRILPLPELPISKTVYLQERGLTISQLEQHKSYMECKEYKYILEDNEMFDLTHIVADMVNCAHNPVIYKYSATLEGQQLSQEDIVNLDKEEQYKIKYPYCLCEVNYLSLKDKSVLSFLNKNCNEVILLSATISQSDKEFLQACFCNEVQEISITKSNQKIDELLLIGYGGYFKYIDRKTNTVNIESLEQYGKILIFEATKNEAEILFRRFPQKFPIAKFNKDDILVNEKFSENWHFLISHSRGNIGRAVNLPQFYTCFIDTIIYKPSNAYDLKNFTLDEILKRQEDDRRTTVVQNAGRILRGKGRKVICLLNVNLEELEYFKKRFEIMVNTDIKIQFIEEDQNKLVNAINCYHKTGELIQIEEYKKVDQLIDGDKSVLSKKQRMNLTDEEMQKYASAKENKKRIKRQVIIEKKIEQIKDLEKNNIKWREIRSRINFSRLSKEEQEYILTVIKVDEENVCKISG